MNQETDMRKWPTEDPMDQASIALESLIWEDKSRLPIRIVKKCCGCGALTLIPYTAKVVMNKDASRFTCLNCLNRDKT